MSYDMQGVPSFPAGPEPDPRDLELLVVVLEVGAILLTDEPDATFTVQELVDEARRLGGDDVDEGDLRIVLGYVKFLRRCPGGRLALR